MRSRGDRCRTEPVSAGRLLTLIRSRSCCSWHSHLSARLSTDAVAEIVRRRAAAAGLEEEKFSGHSLRVGFAAAAGVEGRAIMRQTRHRSSATVRRYIRDGELFARNLSQEVGL